MSIEISDVLGGFLYPIIKDMTEDGGGLDFFNKNVQFSADANNVATSEATFVFSGPPVLRNDLEEPFETYLEPLGAVQQYSLQQGGQIIPFTELGSKLKRHSRGAGQYTASLARVHTRHSDLKWALYAWLDRFVQDHHQTDQLQLGLFPSASDTTNNSDSPDSALREASLLSRQWVGLESEVFNLPFGLLCVTGSAGGNFIHVEYLEACYIQSSGRGVTAGNAMIVPNVNLVVTRPKAYATTDGESLLSNRNVESLKVLKDYNEYRLAAPFKNDAGTLS
jgi:hypothetical protein